MRNNDDSKPTSEKEICEILKVHINELSNNYGKFSLDWNDIRPSEGQL